jgi:hypothetical protein
MSGEQLLQVGRHAYVSGRVGFGTTVFTTDAGFIGYLPENFPFLLAFQFAQVAGVKLGVATGLYGSLCFHIVSSLFRTFYSAGSAHRCSYYLLL